MLCRGNVAVNTMPNILALLESAYLAGSDNLIMQLNSCIHRESLDNCPMKKIQEVLWQTVILGRGGPGRTSWRRWHSRWCGHFKMCPPNSWYSFHWEVESFHVPIPCPWIQALCWTNRIKQREHDANSPALVLRNWQLLLLCLRGHAYSWNWATILWKSLISTQWMFYHIEVSPTLQSPATYHFQNQRWRLSLIYSPFLTQNAT